MPRRRSWSAVIAVVVMAAAFGLSVGAGAQGSDKKEIVFGYAVSMTGRFATEGVDVQRGYEYFRDTVNAQGGIFVKDLGKKLPVRLVEYDDASDASNSVKLYERLITVDKVDFTLGPWGSGINFAVSAVTEKHKYPMVLTSGSSDRLYQRGFKYVFSNTQMASNQGTVIVEVLKGFKDKVKSVAVLHENFLFTTTIHDSLIPKLKASGFEVVLDEQYPLGGKDFAGILVRVKSLKPDAILVLNVMPSSIYVTKQAGELGIKTQVFWTTIGPLFREFREGVGHLAENVFENGYFDKGLPFKGAREFSEALAVRQRNDKVVRFATDAYSAYIGTQIVSRAIEVAGTLDREAVAKAMRSTVFETIGGQFEYDENGVNKRQTLFAVQSQGPQNWIVYPSTLANGKPQLGWPKEK